MKHKREIEWRNGQTANQGNPERQSCLWEPLLNFSAFPGHTRQSRVCTSQHWLTVPQPPIHRELGWNPQEGMDTPEMFPLDGKGALGTKEWDKERGRKLCIHQHEGLSILLRYINFVFLNYSLWVEQKGIMVEEGIYKNKRILWATASPHIQQ